MTRYSADAVGLTRASSSLGARWCTLSFEAARERLAAEAQTRWVRLTSSHANGGAVSGSIDELAALHASQHLGFTPLEGPDWPPRLPGLLSDYPQYWCVVGRLLEERETLAKSRLEWSFQLVSDLPTLVATEGCPLHVSWHVWEAPTQSAVGIVEGVLDFDWEREQPDCARVEALVSALVALPELQPVLATAYFLFTMRKGFHLRYDFAAHRDAGPRSFIQRVRERLESYDTAGGNLDPPHWFRRVPGSIQIRQRSGLLEPVRTRVLPASPLDSVALHDALEEWLG